MGIPQTVDTIPLPVPTKGFNWQDPLPTMDPNYSPWMINMETESQYIKIRNPIHHHCTLPDANHIVQLMAVPNTGKLYAYAQEASGNHTIYDVTSSTPSVAYTTSGATAGPTVFSHRHALHSYFIPTKQADWAGQGAYLKTDGTWGALGFTVSSSSTFCFAFTSYKGAAYLFEGTDAVGGPGFYLNYGTLAQVTGALTQTTLNGLFHKNMATGVNWAGNLSSPSGMVDEAYIAFGSSEGEVLIYGGDNPGANNWGLVGRFDIGKPLYANAVLEYNNDVLICTTQGIVSLRRLFQYGSNSDRITISETINRYWTKLVAFATTPYATNCSIAYWPEQNKIYIYMDAFLTQAGAYDQTASTLFVYNPVNESWAIHKIPQTVLSRNNKPGNVTYLADALYFSSMNKVVTMMAPYDYSDNYFADELQASTGSYAAIDYEVQSAYHNFNQPYRKKIVKGWEPHLETDFTSTGVTMKTSVDFGRKVSAAAAGHFNSANGTLTHHLPFYSVGGEGNYLQYRILGTADTSASKGLNIYAVGAAIA